VAILFFKLQYGHLVLLLSSSGNSSDFLHAPHLTFWIHWTCTRNFNNSPSLTTTMATSVNIVDNIEATSDVVVMTNTKITHDKIQQVQCIQKVKCGACKKSLELPEEDNKRTMVKILNKFFFALFLKKRLHGGLKTNQSEQLLVAIFEVYSTS
jgi:hypothetical protein